MVECPSCGARHEPQLVCPDCSAPLGAELDCFNAIGIPRKLVLDAAGLERIYHDLSRVVHPDRFATSPAKVRAASLRSTALLTRSYRTLRDPVSRGLYWLELNGQKLAENNKQVPRELAELVFDVQEQLADLRTSGDGDRKALADAVAARRAEVQNLMHETFADLNRNFQMSDAGGADQSALLGELKRTLSRIAYLRTLIRDVDRELENAKAA